MLKGQVVGDTVNFLIENKKFQGFVNVCPSPFVYRIERGCECCFISNNDNIPKYISHCFDNADTIALREGKINNNNGEITTLDFIHCIISIRCAFGLVAFLGEEIPHSGEEFCRIAEEEKFHRLNVSLPFGKQVGL